MSGQGESAMRAQSNCKFSSPTVELYDGRNPVVTYTERAFEEQTAMVLQALARLILWTRLL